MDEPEKSLADLDIAIVLDPDIGDAYYWRAKVLQSLGRIDEAVTAVGHAGSCSTGDLMRVRAIMLRGSLRDTADDSLGLVARAWYMTRATISEYNGDPRATESYLTRLALSGVSSRALSESHYALGALYQNIGDSAGALRAYEKAIACTPFDPKLHLARLYGNYLRDRLDLALADAETVLVRSPTHGWALSDRCLIKSVMQRYEDALIDCEAALVVPNSVRFATLVNRGVALFHLGRFEEARASFNQSLAVLPGYPYALYGRGVLKLRAGDNDGHADMADAKRANSRVEAEYQRWKMQP